MAKQVDKFYNYQELSAFCLQISMLLSAGVALDEGLSIMSEDAASEQEKGMLIHMSEEIELGEPFYKVLEETQGFPPYVVKMAKLGQQSGTMDQMMESLSVYYEKEYYLMKNIRNAITYPIIMIVMLLVVLVVLFVKVMPIFENVYEQLGAQISPVAASAIRFGGIFSIAALILAGILVVAAGAVYLASRFGKTFSVIEKLQNKIKRSSKIALAVANRRFTSVLALTLHSGMELEKGLELAGELVENSKVSEQIVKCKEDLNLGAGYYEAMKNTGLFSGFHIQMIKVGTRSGHLDTVMEEISKNYEQQADGAIEQMLARFEPTLVAVLAVAVGMILLSVMLPLAGILSAIG